MFSSNIRNTIRHFSVLRLAGKREQQQQQQPVALSVSECQKYLVLDNKELKLNQSRFPLLWLRDNCKCEKCYHPQVNRRIIDWSHFPFKSLAIKSCTLDEERNSIRLLWNDNHESVFTVPFFQQHRFERETTEAYLRTKYRLEKQPWSKYDDNFTMPKFNLEEILFNEDAVELKRWLHDMCVHGMAILEAPAAVAAAANKDPQLLRKLMKKVFGFSKQTHYGREFRVENRNEGITNVAYLNSNLQSHTDLPYYDYVPGVTILHCLHQSKVGGSSTLIDGFKIAQRLQVEHPEAFDILTRVPVNWIDQGVEAGLRFHKIQICPVIALKNGQVDRIKFSVPQRDCHFSVADATLVQRWYEAMHWFMVVAQEEVLEFKVEENQMLAFDNVRLLHGRTSYDAQETRCMIGSYVDWDELYSKYRTLDDK